MYALMPLIDDLTLMLGLAAIVVVLFQRIRQPVVLGYLIAGMMVGPNTPPYLLLKDSANVQVLSELGVIFLMFSLGLDFSFHKLSRVGFSASIIGCIEITLMIMIGYTIGQFMGWAYYDSLFLGAALSISSTTIIVKAINELKLNTKRFAELVVGVLIVEDLIAILLLAILSIVVATHNIWTLDVAIMAMKLFLVVGVWFLLGYFFVPPFFRGIAAYLSEETLTIVSVALCLFLVSIASYFNYSTALGAFIMGSILAETILVHRIQKLIEPIRDIFAAVFFISVGTFINPSVIVAQWQLILFVSFITIIAKIISTSVASFLTGQSINTSIRTGCSMAQIGEFSFIIIALGMSLHVLNDMLFPIVITISALTTFATPYLIRLSGVISAIFEKQLSERAKFFLDTYSAWVYRTQSNSRQQSLFRGVTVRLFINGVIVAILFMVVNQKIFPQLALYIQNIEMANILALLISLAVSSPFIWGMLFSYRAVKISEYSQTWINPVAFFVWLITLAELELLSLAYFRTHMMIAFAVIVALIYFLFAYKQLEKSYRWFEKQLIRNIKARPDKQLQYEILAPWETHFVEIEVHENSVFVGKSLKECRIRQAYGINVVAIYHGNHGIVIPRGHEMILPEDKLIVLGTDRQIEAFKKEIEIAKQNYEHVDFFGHFTLKTILLEKNHSLINKTIRNSKIRDLVNGLVVGLERDNQRVLNPDPDTLLKTNDLLFIVGEANKIKAYS